MKDNVAVVIYNYKSILNENEEISLNRTLKILKPHPIYMVLPNNINDCNFKTIPGLNLIKLNPKHFLGIRSYCETLLNPSFYKIFDSYEYILNCHLDVFIFRDELNEWCKKGYDYIGGPWLESPIYCSKRILKVYPKYKFFGLLKLIVFKMLKIKKNVAGNSGFALINVQKMIKGLENSKNLIDKWKSTILPNEDVFFSFFIPINNRNFKIAPWKEALKFAFDHKPSLAYQLNGKQLPFAAHGWWKYDLEFWNSVIEESLDFVE